ncbi:hypothetical protein [Haloarcula montana]|uniref:hypothetical protein n=1 Tax=Haloarcula montana TaxID=3111776 RepID=UPI002D76DC31|nr:hypothetical protein [Haloarcula sp. GH36]
MIQIEWIIDYVPGWIGPSSIFLGLFVTSLGLAKLSIRHLVAEGISGKDYILWGTIGLLYVWAVTNLLKLPTFFIRYPFVYTAVFIFAAKMIEGAGAIALYQKIVYANENWTLSGGSSSTDRSNNLGIIERIKNITDDWGFPGNTSLKQKAARRLILLLIGIIGSYAAIGTLIFTSLSLPLSRLLIVTWTLATFLVSLLGLTWKVSKINANINSVLLYGTILILAGAEVTNLANLVAEITVFAAGGVGYTIGYLLTMILWLAD